MELIQTDVLKDLLEYGSYALILGCCLIIPLELIVYGIVKAMGFFRL